LFFVSLLLITKATSLAICLDILLVLMYLLLVLFSSPAPFGIEIIKSLVVIMLSDIISSGVYSLSTSTIVK